MENGIGLYFRKEMKILLIGEYSNVHATLARGLGELGHTVTVASDGDSWKDYPRDIDLHRNLESRTGLASFLWRLAKALPQMRGYDVVQLVNPIFVELKAERIMPIYRYLRRNNRKIVLGAFGMDHYWAQVNTDLRPLRYSDFNFPDGPRTDIEAQRFRDEWIGTPKELLNKQIALDCDGIAAGLYEYWATYSQVWETGADGRRICDKMQFIPFPVIPEKDITVNRHSGPVRIFAGISRGRSAYKGTDIMLRAAQDLEAKYPELVKVTVVEGVPFNEYCRLLEGSDLILDQLYSYTPAMNSLLAMSKGIVNVGGGEPENYEILGEDRLRPIVNVQPCYESVFEELEKIILHPEVLDGLKMQSVEYVCKHHDYMKVAQQYADFYMKL